MEASGILNLIRNKDNFNPEPSEADDDLPY